MLVGCGVAERLVRSLGIVVQLPLPQCRLHRGQVQLPLVALPELPPRRAVEALDPAVEFRGSWGKT
jgi:hypothetical protein